MRKLERKQNYVEGKSEAEFVGHLAECFRLSDKARPDHPAKMPERLRPIAESLQGVNVELMSDSFLRRYILDVQGNCFVEHPYFAVETFCRFIEEGIAPPRWVLQWIADSFSTYLAEDDPEPKKLGKCFGFEGLASGSSNPWEKFKSRAERSPILEAMACLMREFGLSRNKAAVAVKEKHELGQSISTIKRWLVEDALYGTLSRAKPRGLTEYDRTKFLSGFSPEVIKAIGRNGSK